MAAPTSSKHEKNLRPKVGVGVVITSPLHPKCVLIGKRKNVHGDGYYALPGGHLEFSETWEECALRETLEETGLSIIGVTFDSVINAVIEEERYHYVVIFMRGEIDLTKKKEPENMEPNKCEGWEWWDWDKFPNPEDLFVPLRIVREKGYDAFRNCPP
ncbi:nucleotide triphosphate diphosphatase NUDT15-like [Acanthaster planci]|uniref:Nucleotide triphosphate diphosphatase NUDT15 n=1 Tax=Acanthaster planci TaxID=133434 RepID=A0A8B7ZSY8_ACAPL|nr:nucleotide triphosphate diphosphatase NUDT15-like [Acanthaster planci]